MDLDGKWQITGGRLARLRERMRSIRANAIALSGQLGEVPRSGTESADRVSGPPLSGNGAERNFRQAPGGLAKWRIGRTAA